MTTKGGTSTVDGDGAKSAGADVAKKEGQEEPNKGAATAQELEKAVKQAQEAAQKAEEAAKKAAAAGADPKASALRKTTLALGTTLAAIGTGLAAVAAADGAAGRLILNRPFWMWLGVALALGAIGVSIAGITYFGGTLQRLDAKLKADPKDTDAEGEWNKANKRRAWVGIGSVVIFLIGFALLAHNAIGLRSAKERPRLTADIAVAGDGVATVTGTVAAQGLKYEEHLFVRVTRKTADADDRETLLGLRVGPDINGDVNRDYSATVPPGDYRSIQVDAVLLGVDETAEPIPSCHDAGATAACVEIFPPSQLRRPPLQVAFGKLDNASPVLDVNVGPVMVDTSEAVVVQVDQRSPGETLVVLHREILVPNAGGSVAASLTVVPDPAYDELCVTAVIADRTQGLANARSCAGGDADPGAAVWRTSARPADRPARPEVTAALTTTNNETTVTVDGKASGLAADETVTLTVATRQGDADSPFAAVHTATYVPAAGSVSFTGVAVPLAAGDTEVCVLAEVTPSPEALANCEPGERSAAATLRVPGADAAADPTFTTHPKPVSVAAGSPATFSVATSDLGDHTLQWYEQPPDGDPAPIEGATAAEYTIDAVTTEMSGTLYFVKIVADGDEVAVSEKEGVLTVE